MLSISPQSMAALSAGGRSPGSALAAWLAAHGGPVPATEVDAAGWLERGHALAASYDLLPGIETEEERFYLATLAAMLIPQPSGRQVMLLGDALTSPAAVAERVAAIRALALQP